MGRLKDLGAPEFPAGGYPLSDARDAADNTLTLAKVEAELAFLDDPALPLPTSLPMTSMWLSQTWQHRVVDDELEGLARAVYDPNSATRPDWSPTVSRTWADKVLTASPEGAEDALLREAPVARETFATDKASPLMARTITKAAATASGAVGSAKQVPGVLKPAVTTLRTLTLGAYRAVSLTKGVTKRMLALGIGLLVLGVALAIQSATLAGVTGLVMARRRGHSRGPGDVAAVRQAARRPAVGDADRRRTRAGDAGRPRLAGRDGGGPRAARREHLLAGRDVVASLRRHRGDRARRGRGCGRNERQQVHPALRQQVHPALA